MQDGTTSMKQKFRDREIEFENLKKSSRLVFKQKDQNAKVEASTRQEIRKKKTTPQLVIIATIVFGAMGCYFHLCHCQNARPILLLIISNEEQTEETRTSFEFNTFEKRDIP